jgi:hypothetical protein
MAKALNINVITKAVNTAFNAAITYGEQVAILQREFKGADRDAIKAIVCPLAATKYDAKYIDGQWVDPKCAAKRYANRLIAAIMGKSSGATEAIEIPAEILAAAAKLAKLCNQYEKASSLASTALAQAFAQ